MDPISHELLLSLAREMQCPKKVSSLCSPRRSSSIFTAKQSILLKILPSRVPFVKWSRDQWKSNLRMLSTSADGWLKGILQTRVIYEQLEIGAVWIPDICGALIFFLPFCSVLFVEITELHFSPSWGHLSISNTNVLCTERNSLCLNLQRWILNYLVPIYNKTAHIKDL